jgi:hypothetical protein
MHIRTSLATLVFLASNAAASASLLPAVEVRSVGTFYDSAGFATLTITSSGRLYVVLTSGLNGPYPSVPYVDAYPQGVVANPLGSSPAAGYTFTGSVELWCSPGTAPLCYYSRGLSQSGRVIDSVTVTLNPSVYEANSCTFVGTTPPWTPNSCGNLAVPASYLTGGREIQASAINNGDLIVGLADSKVAGAKRVPIWWPNPTAVAQELPRIAGVDSGPFPIAVSDKGVIVGNTAGSTTRRAAIWKPAGFGYTLEFLGELPGGVSSRAFGVSFLGSAVGSSDDGSATQVAVVWTPAPGGYTVTPLPVPPGGSCSRATAINVYHDIVGNCTLAGGAERGVLWQYLGAGTWELVHQLEPLPGDTRSTAYALNNERQMGGASGGTEESQRPTLWSLPAAAPVSVPALSPPAWLLLGSILAGTALARLRRREQSPSRVRT